jgi:hypothetical protein
MPMTRMPAINLFNFLTPFYLKLYENGCLKIFQSIVQLAPPPLASKFIGVRTLDIEFLCINKYIMAKKY